MSTFFLTVFIALFLLWFISRVLAWAVSWLLYRYLKVTMKVGKVGLFTFKHIQLTKNQTTVEIEGLWLSSSLVSNDIKKLVAVCIGDVRIQTQPPGGNVRGAGGENGRRTPTDMANTSGKSSRLLRYIHYTQYIGIHVNNITVIILRPLLEDCLLHTVIQEVDVLCTIEYGRFEMAVSMNGVSSKILRSIPQGSEQQGEAAPQPCMASLCLSMDTKLMVDLDEPSSPESLELLVRKPELMITEGLLLCIQHDIRLRSLQQEEEGEEEGRMGGNVLNQLDSEAAHNEDPAPNKLLRFLPKKLDLEIDHSKIILSRETANRTISANIEKIELNTEHELLDDQLAWVILSYRVQDVQSSSPQAKFTGLTKMEIEVKVNEFNSDLRWEVHSGYIHYHHEDVKYWWNVLAKFRPTQRNMERHLVADTREHVSQRNKLQQFLHQRAVTVTIELWNSTAAVAMATCSGYHAGLSHLKVSLKMQPQATVIEEDVWLLSRNIKGEVELNQLYCKLADAGIETSDMTNNHHCWNNILYLGILLFKLNKVSSEIKLEGMLDSVQLEWSSNAITVVSQLLSGILKPLPLRPQPIRNIPYRRSPSGLQTDWAAILPLCVVQIKCTNLNFFTCNEFKVCLMLRLDDASILLRNSIMTLGMTGTKLVYLHQAGTYQTLVRSSELNDYLGNLRSIKITYSISKEEVAVELKKEVHLNWDTKSHMCVHQVLLDISLLRERLPGNAAAVTVPKSYHHHHPSGRQRSSEGKVIFKVTGDTVISARLSHDHQVALMIPELSASISSSKISMQTSMAVVTFDGNKIFHFKCVDISSIHHSDQLKLERGGFDTFVLPTNKAWSFAIEELRIVFPWKHNFGLCFEEVVNTVKWLKLIHKRTKKPFTVDSPLPPDLHIRIKTLTIQLDDDPFEVKLADNYELVVDENNESEKRFSAMDKRIQELRKRHGLLPESKIEELYASLTKKNAEVYIQRSQQLYAKTPMRSRLITWGFDEIEILAMADTSLHGKENAVKHMRDIDKDSPYPEEGLEFTTLWCRQISASYNSFYVHLRDYPQPMFDIKGLSLWGRLIGAEQAAARRARRSCTVVVEEPWGNVTVERSMPALKFYHDFSCDVTSYSLSYGSCWEPLVAQVNHSINLINKPSLDPSLPMPYWDKIRLLFHGRLTMSVLQMSWLYHASLDPYNTTELMDWTWTNLILDWTNAKFVLRGDLDIYARTASKYDDCRLLHLPNLRYCIKLEWLTLGDPNDHHAVMPCAPDKLPEYSLEEHDSFRAFRSKNVNMHWSFETKPPPAGKGEESDIPSCVFYASTLRLLDKIKMCFAKTARPIRRGKLFGVTTPRKPQTTRHFRKCGFSMDLHAFHISYWMSFAKQHGVEMRSGPFNLSSGYQMTLTPVEDGLIHRPASNWSITHLKIGMEDAQIWLCSIQGEDNQENVSLRGQKVNKSFFLNVTRVSYERDEVQIPEGEDEEGVADHSMHNQENPTHKVQIHNMKGAWTKSNRMVAFGLYDGYLKANTIKRNLSSEALKSFKVESTQTPAKGRSFSMGAGTLLDAPSATMATPSPMTKIQSGHAYSMLTKLVAETDSKFVAFTEEPSGGNMEQLHGIAACQTDDVLKKNWLIEMHNSQVLLKGIETEGYIIVSAGRAQILSCEHQPIWHDRQLKTKTTWMGSVEHMQYYATVDSGSFSEDNFTWLTMENVQDRPKTEVDQPIPEMVGSGQSVGGVVSATVGVSNKGYEDQDVQLQRIISRCKCQFFYADYGEADPNTLPHVPLPVAEDSDMMEQEKEGADSFTLLHHDLNICTNPLQYSMILDVLNNLLLYVEPKRKEENEKLLSAAFKMQLSSQKDQKTPILYQQNVVRGIVLKIRRLERELYMVHRALEDTPINEELLEQSEELERQLYLLKEQLNIANEDLTIKISCFKESQLQQQMQLKMKAHKATVTRRNEVCFKHAQWRLTETDGQIGICDMVLRNFVYSKVNKSEDSWSHLLELGWVKVTNLLPDTIYKDVLVPQDVGNLERQVALRIFCRVKQPVGGISVKEHFEVNVVPLTIQLTHHFFKTMMAFFFPGKNLDSEEHQQAEAEPEPEPSTKNKSKKKGSARWYTDDIDKMKERAARNNTFLYCKIPEVPLKVSYKGEKDKNIADVHDFSLVLPTLEYHNNTWTWLDLAMVLKNDSKRVLISQAVKQKLHLRSRGGDEAPLTDVQQEEDKAKMLLGAKLFADKPTSKKSLFGKSSK